MSLMDLTLLGPVNDLLALWGGPRLGLDHLALGHVALLGIDGVLAVAPSRRRPRRRRRGGFGLFGFLGLLCCFVPLVVVAAVGYLVWTKSQGAGRRPGGPAAPPAPSTPPPPPGHSS
jgi:hypothetical protein